MRRHAKASSAGSSHGTSRARKGLFGIACLCLLGLVAFVGSGASPASADDACPNEALRAENQSLALPECRAYELVTTSFLGGFGASQGGGVYDFTDNGSVIYQTFAGDVANSGSGGQGSRYVATRSDSGWQPVANLNGPSKSPLAGPDAIFGSGAGPYAASGDLKSSLWYMAKAGQSGYVIDFYLRKPDGSFALIGPYSSLVAPPGVPGHVLPAAHTPLNYYIGASADLSHLLIVEEGNGATLGPKGLYEYVGTSENPPRRVDVDNFGNPISNCGTSGTNHNKTNAISIDGRVIFFVAAACSGGPAANEVWARVDGTTSYDASQSQCTRLPTDPGGVCNGPSAAAYEGAAVDGSRVYFTTAQQLVNGDTDTTSDLYAYDVPTASNPNPSPTLFEVSGASSGAQVQGVVRLSDDGSKVYFVAKGILAANTDARGESAVAGNTNLYLWEQDANHPTGQTTFVGKVSASDNLWGSNSDYINPFKMAQISADGRYLVLGTFSPLLSTDTDNARDVYRYDAETGETVRLSTDVSGGGGNTNGLSAVYFPMTYVEPEPSHRTRTAVSADGEAVTFETAEALSPADTNGASDIYLWRAGHVYLVSSGTWPGGASSAKIDASGENIYFDTKEALTANDGDNVGDAYDARIGGGFSFPSATSCVGEACQSSPSSSPVAPAPATDRPNGSGNVKPKAKHCAKGKVVRNGHCVKRHAKKQHKKGKGHAKRARHNSGGGK